MMTTPEARAAREATRRKKRRWQILLAATVVLFLVGQTWANVTATVTSSQSKDILKAVRQTQVDRIALGDDTHRAALDAAKSSAQSAAILALLTDCLQPSGECAKRGAQNTADILAQIKLYIRDTAACQSLVATPSDATALEACVTRLEHQEPQ